MWCVKGVFRCEIHTDIFIGWEGRGRAGEWGGYVPIFRESSILPHALQKMNVRLGCMNAHGILWLFPYVLVTMENASARRNIL